MRYKTLTVTKEKKYLKILTTMCYLQGYTTQLRPRFQKTSPIQ